jgi:hypothetical protein
LRVRIIKCSTEHCGCTKTSTLRAFCILFFHPCMLFMLLVHAA